MHRTLIGIAAIVAGVTLAGSDLATAQELGTFRWQLRPYCNVVSLRVVASGPSYRLEGYDDQCGATTRAVATGLAILNPSGSIGFGLTIVTAPGGTPVHVDASITLATLSGSWTDSESHGGTFAFTPGPAAGGPPRPTAAGVPLPDESVTTAALAPNAVDGTKIADGTVGAADVNAADIQRRVTGVCPNGSALVAIAQDGTVTCHGAVPPSSGFLFQPEGSFAATTTSIAPADAIPATGSGRRLMWFSGAAALRAGVALGSQWDAASLGFGSVALGADVTASGRGSTALGFSAKASGDYAFAAGDATTASGENSTALGWNSVASGYNSTALGESTRASGTSATAVGYSTIASGDYSTAMGSWVSTAGHIGTFIHGDASTSTTAVANAPNEFVVRAAGGFRLRTAPDLSTGCNLPAGSGTWACTSDRRLKRQVAPLDGEVVLTRLADLPVTTWSFTTEPGVRHAGPMAQDFYAAFGLGVGDTSIGHTDLTGINTRAIQALELRTREIRVLEDTVRRLTAAIEALAGRLAAVEAAGAATRAGAR